MTDRVPLIRDVPLAWTDRIVAGPDGNIWFTDHDTNQIGRISTAGPIAEFPIPTASAGLKDIAPGPDGNVWFTESDARNIGPITPREPLTEFCRSLASDRPGFRPGWQHLVRLAD